jgi:hypothetical protein
MKTEKTTFATVVDICSLSSWEHRHGITAEIFVEGSIYTSLNARHASESSHEPWRAESIIIETAEL